MIQDGASAKQLDADRLSAVNAIESSFEERPEIIARLLHLEAEGLDLKPLSLFIDGNSRSNLVAKMVQDGASAAELLPARLSALEWAQDLFGTSSSTFQGILSLEHKGVQISELQQFFDRYGKPVEGKSRIEQMVADDLPLERFNQHDMVARAFASDMFGVDSPVIEKFVALCKSGLDPRLIRGYVGSASFPAVERMIADGADLNDLSGDRLFALVDVYRAFPSHPEVIAKLRHLEKDNLNILEMGRFVAENPVNSELVVDLLNRGYRAEELNLAKLRDLLPLRKVSLKLGLPSETEDYLEGLQRNGLSGARLAEYIAELPERRGKVVQELAAGKADISRINDQMRLSVFPEDVAGKLADGARTNGMTVGQLVGNLRDWQSGRHFMDLVTKHVESNKSISAAEIGALALQAREGSPSHAEQSPATALADLASNRFCPRIRTNT